MQNTAESTGRPKPPPFAASVDRVLAEVREMLIAKNRKYGNSALEPVRVFSKADAIEQLNVRIDDKLSRIANRQNDEDEDPEKDLIGYLVLKMIHRETSRGRS